MQLNDLPDDVLAIVFKQSLPTAMEPKSAFKSRLYLLSICRRWRQLALPMVFDSVHIQYGTWTMHGDDGQYRNWAGSEPEDVAVITNMDLFATSACASVVKRVTIEVHCLCNPHPGLQAVIERLRMAAVKWEGVRALGLYIHPTLITTAEHNIDVALHEEDIEQVSGALAGLMPGLHELIFGGISWNDLTAALSGRLAGSFAGQLKVLESKHPITVPQEQVFTQLTRVSLSGDGTDGSQLPRMSSKTIEQLSMTGLPSRHSWSAFISASSGMSVEFPQLKYLNVVYIRTSTRNMAIERRVGGGPWVLHFPALTSLVIQSPESCPLLGHMVLPPRMKMIRLATCSDVYRRVASMELPATRSLMLALANGFANDDDAVTVASRILGSARGCKEMELVVSDIGLPVLPEALTCTGLTRLFVSASTNVDTMLGLIRRLPNLVRLTLTDLSLELVQSDISIPESGAHEPVVPLGTKLARLAISFQRQLYPPRLAIPVAKYLLLAIPSLIDLFAAQVPKEPMADFVDEFAQWYPRLASVGLHLYEEGGPVEYHV